MNYNDFIPSKNKPFNEEVQNLEINVNKIIEVVEDVYSNISRVDSELGTITPNDREYASYKRKLLKKRVKLNDSIRKNKDIANNPYFGRINVNDNLNNKIDMYIGEKPYYDKEGNQIVYDWRAPVSGLFYQNQLSYAYNDTIYKLKLKRQILVKNSKLINCTQQYPISNENENGMVTDAFLQKVLEDKKNEKEFSDIIKTIQDKQNEIIRTDINKNIVVQGCAGSGKTVIILHRLSYLLFNNPKLNPSSFLFIAPSETFKSKLNNLNIKLGISEINTTTITNYYETKIKTFFNESGKVSEKGKTNFSKVKEDTCENDELYFLRYSEEYFEKGLNEITNYINIKLEPLTDFLEIEKFAPRKKDLLSYLNDVEEKTISLLKTIGPNIESTETFIETISEKYFECFSKAIGYDNFKMQMILTKDEINKIKNDNNVMLDYLEKESDLKINSDFDKEYNNKAELEKLNLELDDLEKKIENEKKKLENKGIKLEPNSNFDITYYINELESEISKLEKKIFNTKKNLKLIENSKLNLFIKNYVLERNILNEKSEELKEYNSKLVSLKKYEKRNTLSSLLKRKEVLNKEIKDITKSEPVSENFDPAFEKSHFCKKVQKDIEHLENAYTTLKNKDGGGRILKAHILLNKYLKSDKTNFSIDELYKFEKYRSKLDLWFHYKDVDFKKFRKPTFIFDINDYEKSYKSEMILNLKNIINNKRRTLTRNQAYILLRIVADLGLQRSKKYSYLYIDEAQDYNDSEIHLIKKLELDPQTNLFGDVNQRLFNNVPKRKSWSSLKRTVFNSYNNIPTYDLKENYRNTSEIIDYCNNFIDNKMIPIGTSNGLVKTLKFRSLNQCLDFAKEKNTVVITKDSNEIKLFKENNIECYTIKEAKGLEFESVVVIDNGFTIEEKYVSYTRSLKKLYIFEK